MGVSQSKEKRKKIKKYVSFGGETPTKKKEIMGVSPPKETYLYIMGVLICSSYVRTVKHYYVRTIKKTLHLLLLCANCKKLHLPPLSAYYKYKRHAQTAVLFTYLLLPHEGKLCVTEAFACVCTCVPDIRRYEGLS